MIHIVYASSATSLPSEEDLLDLLRVSRTNNQRAGISGLLLYSGGTYFQVLEGPEAAVEATFERITTDRRHRGIQVLLRKEKEERDFPGWAMGFCNESDLDARDRDAFSSFLEDGHWEGGDARRVQLLFERFRSIAHDEVG